MKYFLFLILSLFSVTAFSQAVTISGFGNNVADTQSLSNRINQKANTSSVSSLISKQDTMYAVTGVSPITGANLQSYVTAYAGRILQLPAGTFTITSAITVPANTKIIGSGTEATIIQLGGAATVGFSIASANAVTIQSLCVKGTYATPNVSGTGVINSLSDLTSLNGIGSEYGISITGTSYGTTLRDIHFRNLSGAGLYVTQSSSAYIYSGSVSADNLMAFDCYSGYYFPDTGEYNNVVNIKSLNCLIGIITLNGNLYLSNSAFNNCRVGFYAGLGSNDSHISISNCSFNHDILYNIASDSTSKGLFFTGCEMFGGITMISRTKGFSFDAGRFEGTVTVIDGGINTVTDSKWFTKSLTLTSNTGNPNFQIKNCHFIGNGALVSYFNVSTTSYTLNASENEISHTVGAANYYLMDATKYAGAYMTIKNIGSGTITLNAFSASQIWNTSAVTTLSITVGGVARLFCNGTFWEVQ